MIFFPDYVRRQRESYERELTREREENEKLRAKLLAAHEEIGVLKWELSNSEKR